MAFSPKSWLNSPSTTTPLSAAALIDLETRVTNIGFGGLNLQTGASCTAVAGDVVLAEPASGGITVNLPTPGATASTTVTVWAGPTISGTNQVTISAGANFILGYGVGIGVSSIVLGTPGASVVLCNGGGSTWFIVSGQQDSGWVDLSLTASWTNVGGNNGGSRVVADRVYLRGVIQNNTGAGATTPFATFPSNIRPATAQSISLVSVTTGNVVAADAGTLSTGGVLTLTASIANTVSVIVENTSYALR